MLIEDSQTQLCVSDIAQQIQDLFLTPVEIGKSKKYISASIGITVCNNVDKNAEELLLDASYAMNRAHALGGGRFELYDSTIHNHYIANI